MVEVKKTKGWKHYVGLLSSFFVLICILVLCSILFFYDRVTVPTASMHPTIQMFDRLLVTRSTDIRRGDILTFWSTEHDITLVKRVIGLPGERVELRSGEVWIDGQRLLEPYVSQLFWDDHVFDVPHGHYLFLGDNRASSSDARVWSNPYIGEEFIRGRVVFRYYPVVRLGRVN